MAETLYHMCESSVWRQCIASQTPYYPQTYQADGFIHLTADPNLLLTVANHFYKGDAGKWVVLCIDSSKLTSEVKYEPAAPVGDRASHGLGAEKDNEPLFPHLYGTIDFAAVFKELGMERDDNGTFLNIIGI